MRCRSRISAILREESALIEIVKLIGADVLPDDQKLTIDIARIIRVGFLQQNAYHAQDTYVPLEKQLKMMRVILHLYDRAKDLLRLSIPISRIEESGLYDKLTRIKYDVPNDDLSLIDSYMTEIDSVVDGLIK